MKAVLEVKGSKKCVQVTILMNQTELFMHLFDISGL